MFRTRITDLYGVEHPIVQGGLQAVAIAELTSAVANAGAMGFMTALSYETPEDLRKGIAKCRDMTDRPFGINITLLPALDPPDYPGYIQVCAEEGIEFLETAGRNPEPFMPILEEAGIKVTHKCTSIRHALKAQSVGVAAVSIDGFECAGHPGEDDIPGLVLIPCAADQLTVPIIASGGFGDARGLVAALALGADAINMGTRFMATQEAPIHENVKRKLVEGGERDTALIFRTMRNTARIFRNSVAEEVIEIEGKGNATIGDIAHLVAGERGRKVLDNGDMEAGIWSAGMVAGLIKDIPTCEELVHRIVSEAADLIHKRLTQFAVA